MEDHLQQQVTQFVTQGCHIAALDRIVDFVSFLNRIRCNRREGLRDIPFTALLGIAKAGHDREEAGPGGLMILVGDSIHNFADGIMIAAAFATDPGLGWLTTFAIATHEIPQEIGDYILLLNAGYTRSRALLFNGLASLAAVLGGLVGYFALSAGQGLQPYVLILAAASFIYIALADLVPDLHRQSRRAKAGWLKQSMLMLTGIAIIAVLTSHFHLH
jgi:zinc and cadmium transporter